jgi:hypothetical protein
VYAGALDALRHAMQAHANSMKKHISDISHIARVFVFGTLRVDMLLVPRLA